MEYRRLPHGGEKISVLGLGMGGIRKSSDSKIEVVIRTAEDKGIKLFDLCADAKNVYAPFVRDMAGRRETIYFQMHRGGFTKETAPGPCVYRNHCRPCPAGIDVGLVNKYHDLALTGDKLAASHCDDRCPFSVHRSERMTGIERYFAK